MESEAAASLVDQAKASRTFAALGGMKATGASAFLDAFSGLAPQHEDKSCDEICKLTIAYLRVTASNWGKWDYRKGAKIASGFIGDLHAAS